MYVYVLPFQVSLTYGRGGCKLKGPQYHSCGNHIMPCYYQPVLGKGKNGIFILLSGSVPRSVLGTYELQGLQPSS